MKCIQATKTTKHFKAGDIKRVKDAEADSATKDGYWKYVAKSEWKSMTHKSEESQPESQETISEKQLKRKKNTN